MKKNGKSLRNSLLSVALVALLVVGYFTYLYFCPVIDVELVGSENTYVGLNNSYKEKGWKFSYNYQNVNEDNVSVVYKNSNHDVVEEIDTSAISTYTATYSFNYKKASATLTRNINVVDVEPISIHFLELGNKYTGDSIYVKAGETDILIDAGSRTTSTPTIAKYLDTYVTDKKFEYVIATHAHQDHIEGFVGSKANPGIFDRYEIDNIIDFPKTNSESALYSNYVTKRDAKVAAGTNHYTALECFNNTNGAQRSYDIAAGVEMEFLYQRYYEETAPSKNENDYSVCLMINQAENHYLFTGDLETDGEESLVASNTLPEVELFKAAHHGSYTANSDALLSVIKPQNVVVTCVAGSTEYTDIVANTFPSQAAIDVIGKYTNNVYCTTVADGTSYKSMNGTVVVTSDGGDVNVNGTANNTLLKETDWFKTNRIWPSAN